MAIMCAGKGTFFVTEQNTFHQIFWDRTTVYRDDGSARALALAMDSARDDLFTNAALA